jgi:hypothetical protein
MAAASADPTPRDARAAAPSPAGVAYASIANARRLLHVLMTSVRGLIAGADSTARGLIASVCGTACALFVSGAGALVTQAGLGQRASALWMSALALATMTIVPLLMSRLRGRHSTFATAMTLIATMSAMSVVPGYVKGFEHCIAIAALITAIGGALLVYGWRLIGAGVALPVEYSGRQTVMKQNEGELTRAIHATGATALLALLAGLSSGTLARFQLFALCRVGGTQPLWQIAFSLGAVCGLALIAERSGNSNRMLIVLYASRATLIGALAVAESQTLALLAAKIFLVLDCLTIPALMKLRSTSRSAVHASCPGAAHHIGMVAGATLSTTPYFFGDGFIALYALGAIANLICATALATEWLNKVFHRGPPLPGRPFRRARSARREV